MRHPSTTHRNRGRSVTVAMVAVASLFAACSGRSTKSPTATRDTSVTTESTSTSQVPATASTLPALSATELSRLVPNPGAGLAVNSSATKAFTGAADAAAPDQGVTSSFLTSNGYVAGFRWQADNGTSRIEIVELYAFREHSGATKTAATFAEGLNPKTCAGFRHLDLSAIPDAVGQAFASGCGKSPGQIDRALVVRANVLAVVAFFGNPAPVPDGEFATIVHDEFERLPSA